MPDLELSLTYVAMVDPESVLLEEIEDPRIKRDDVAKTYAFAIRQRAEINWARVNEAIIRRWSLSALVYIKDRAWKLVVDHE